MSSRRPPRSTGPSRIGFFWRILLPLSKPGLVTVGILAFVASWNGYLLPLLVISTGTLPQELWPLPLGVTQFSIAVLAGHGCGAGLHVARHDPGARRSSSLAEKQHRRRSHGGGEGMTLDDTAAGDVPSADSVAARHPWHDRSRSVEDRVEALIAEMTVAREGRAAVRRVGRRIRRRGGCRAPPARHGATTSTSTCCFRPDSASSHGRSAPRRWIRRSGALSL